MATTLPRRPRGPRKCYQRVSGLPGWFRAETYIAPADKCLVNAAGCKHYVVFENVTTRTHAVEVQFRCDGTKVRYLKGGRRQSRLREKVEVHSPPYKTTSIMVALDVDLAAIEAGSDETLVIESVIIKPRDGYNKYCPTIESTAETRISVDCAYP